MVAFYFFQNMYQGKNMFTEIKQSGLDFRDKRILGSPQDQPFLIGCCKKRMRRSLQGAPSTENG